jgi:hypothetical protein
MTRDRGARLGDTRRMANPLRSLAARLLAPGLAAALAAALGAPAAARADAEPVALLPASGVNVDAGTLSAAHEVFRTYVEQAGRYTMRVTRAGTAAEAEPSPSDAVAWAAEVRAPLAAVLRLATLGSVLHVRLTVYEAPSGRTVWSDSLPAGAPGDLDPVLKRLATAWARGGKAETSAEIDTVTQKEAEPLLKRTATRQRGLRFGMVRAMDTGLADDPYAIGGGMYWLYDARSWLVDVSLDYYGGKRVHDLAGGFGAYIPLAKTDFAPYLGGGLRYAVVAIDDDAGAGFQPYLAAGVLLGRLSDVGMRAEVAMQWNTFDAHGVRATLLVGTLGVQF